MKLVVYGPEHRTAVAQEDFAVDLHDAATAYLIEAGEAGPEETAKRLAPPRLLPFIEAGEPGLALARAALAWAGQMPALSSRLDLDRLPIQPTWPGRRIAAAGANFADHFAQGMTVRGHPMTVEKAYELVRSDEPLGYWKLPGEAVGHDGTVAIPARCPLLDYEAEVAIIIGRRGKDIPLEEAMSHVWGVTILNDWSVRTPPHPRLFPFSLNLDKNFDGATSCGPAVAFDVDPADLQVKLSVNGAPRQDFNTRDMVYSFAEYIHFLSRDFTLLPGDMIAGGTGAGTAADSSPPWQDGALADALFLKRGDIVEITVEPVGTLRNRIV